MKWNTLTSLFSKGRSLLAVGLLSYALPAYSLTYYLPPEGVDVVGKVDVVKARGDLTLVDIARQYDMGIREMRAANPRLNPNKRLRRGTKVVVPSQFILPPGKREGIVINLAEYRLYYYPEGKNIVITEPVGIGRVGSWKTPEGETKIVEKRKNPYWRPTENVRADARRQGYSIPEVFPPGPDNPLGKYAMRFGWYEYLIHSTNHPEGVGDRVSAGCIRMYPEDIEELFPQIPLNTKVRIINKPYKIGWYHNRLVMEFHDPLEEDRYRYGDGMAPVVKAISSKAEEHSLRIKWREAKRSVKYANGIPFVVGEPAQHAAR